MSKSLLQILGRYEPREEFANILRSADPESIALRADKQQKALEISATFPEIIPARTLYKIEDEIRRTYQLNMVFIKPRYSAGLFGIGCIPDLLTETNRRGIVANGFFNHSEYRLEGNTLTVEIPFTDSGVDLVSDAKTPQVMEEILREQYGVSLHVILKKMHGFDPMDYTSPMAEQLREMQQNAAKAEADYLRMKDSPEEFAPMEMNAEPEVEMLPRAASIYSGLDFIPETNGNFCRIGHALYDLSSPEFVVGEPFEIRPISIASIDKMMRGIVIVGEIFGFTRETSRTGDKFDISFDIFDGVASIEHRAYGVDPEAAGELCSLIGEGSVIAMRGYARRMTKRGKTDTDFTFFYTDIAKIEKVRRKDNAPQKRVELHLHTTMSTMDALIAPDAAIKAAMKWGHSAVAITDHGNVQAFPDAMLSWENNAEKSPDFKVIYGMEAYFVNNTAGAVTGACDPNFSAECVVFDIETTGLSVQNCKITEIGAVKIKNGEVLDRFNTFVDPEVPIPEDVVKLTGITDEMVAGAPKIKEALENFFAFIGNSETGRTHKPLLIAHNANFDIGFIRYFAEACGLPFENPYLDTLALAKFVSPELKNHKLNNLADAYNLGEFNHHRASDDAEMLAMIYFRMTDLLQKMDISTIDLLQKEMVEKTDPLKIKPYHQIILVKNQAGLKNLYRLVSHSYLDYYKRFPRVPKSVLEKYREGLIIGSACESGELFRAILENRPEAEIEEIVNFYDYLEIQPICNNRFLIAEGSVADDEGLRNLNRRIVALGERYNKPVCATCDAHFINKEDELYRKILLAGQKFKDFDKDVGIYYRTTEEMLEEFSYLGAEKAFEVVVTNTNLIADQIERVRPIPKGSYTPEMEGAEQELQDLCWSRAKRQYGDPLPEIVSARLERELSSIIKNGFSVLYLIAQRLVNYSEQQGYLVGSRGSVGSSFVATMAGISEVNPLPPHYYCPQCAHSEFFTDGSVGSGFDLPDKNCPKCGTKYRADGHDIMFETFLGFYGEKSPDIDLNFSGDVQGRVHKYTEELFGKGQVFRAGTLGTLADKTAYGYVAKYVEEKGISLPRAEMNRLVKNCMGVKKTTGQHPGGIIVVPQKYDIYDFTPVQHPADDPNSDIITTHFAFSYLHDTILKLDELGHDMPTKYKWLETFTNTSVLDVAMNDSSVYELLASTKPLGIRPEDIDGCTIGTYGLPELGTSFVQQTLLDAKPRNFADLLKISGLTHGTDVWLGNAQDLIKDGTCDISNVIGCRDDVMLDLIRYGVEKPTAFTIMEAVRKGKGLKPEWEDAMREHNVPEWYIASCKKIKYLFPKAHAAAYVMSAIRLAWYKVHQPVAFYCTFFTVAPTGFDAQVVRNGKQYVQNYIRDILKRGKEASPKEIASIPVLQLVNEAMARGIRFLPVDLQKSHSYIFQPEDGGIRMPFSSLPGLGETAAQHIIAAREEEPFFSVEDLQIRAKLSKALVDMLRANGVLDNVSETDQLVMKF